MAGKRKKKRLEPGRTMPVSGDAILSATPAAVAMLNQFVDEVSARAGRRVSADEISATFKAVQRKCQTDAPDYRDPAVRALFFELIRGGKS